ncbi:MAG: hypothetical protein EKK55_06970 [Rhodocyclaceae bacterium]|nr:MAG: hypothetical protein EKK55_06970 [Rhodocyclaceae bacterium]
MRNRERPFPPIGRDGDYRVDPLPEVEPQGGARAAFPHTWAGGYREPPPVPPCSPAHEIALAFAGKLVDALAAERGEFFGFSGSLRVAVLHFSQHPRESDRATLLDHLRHLAARADGAGRADLAGQARDLAHLAAPGTCPLDLGERGAGVALPPARVRVGSELG